MEQLSGIPNQLDLGTINRVLLAVRPGELSDAPEEIRALEAAVLPRLGQVSPAVTLLTVAPPAGQKRADRYLARMAQMFPADSDVSMRVARGNPAQAILEEAGRGYDLIAMGAPVPDAGSSHLFGSLVEEVVTQAPCPSLVFRARAGRWPPRRIIVDTGGSETAARAAALAFALGTEETEVLLYHVVDPDATESSATSAGSVAMRMDVAHGIVNELRETGTRLGMQVAAEVTMGESMGEKLVDRSRDDVDLIVVGTGLRTAASRLSLDPRAERLVAEAPCSVVVLTV